MMQPTSVKINGIDLSLYFDFNNVAEYENEFDMSIMYTVRAKRLGIGAIRNLYWTGLQHEKKFSLNEVGNMLQESVKSGEHTINSLAEPLFKALREAGILEVGIKDSSKGDTGERVEESKN